MTHSTSPGTATKYPLSMRIMHWLRAVLVLGLIWSGWTMTGLPDDTPMSTFDLFYSNHKQFGVLVWLLALTQLAIRWRSRAELPRMPESLLGWEKLLSHAVHRLMIALTLLIPVLGYMMSSSFSQSDGVPFFFIHRLPELLPKNDNAFETFQALHEYAAYALLLLIALHIAGGLKHRLLDKGGDADVLSRMF